MLKYDLNLREYWRIIKRRKLIILFTVIVMSIFSFISAILGKPVPIYKTTSTIKIEKSVSYVGMNAVQSLSGASNAMETQTYVIKSYYILELTAKKMGLIPADLSPDEVRQNNKYINIINDLQERVQTEQRGNSDLVDVTITANEPKFATNFCNTLTDVYRTQHSLDLNRRTIEGKKFIESQFGISREKLTKSDETIKRFREQNKWSSLEGESLYLANQINRLQTIRDQDQIIIQKINSAAAALNAAEYSPLTSKVNFYFEEASPPYRALNDRLVNLMLERDSLLQTYTDNFPQIAAIKTLVHDTIESMKAQLTSQRRNLASNIRIYNQQIAESTAKFKKLPEKALELTRLDRDAAIAKELYSLLERRYQETLIAEAEKLDEVKVVKPAIEPASPINPPKTGTNTILGTVLGLILGVVFAFLIETFDTSIAAIEEVEEFLGVQVLGVIPFVSVEEIKTLLGDDPDVSLNEDKVRRYARLAAHFVPASTLSESYKALRTSLNFVCTENDLKTILFTSSSPGEGKTSIVTNLAITMAQIGQKVLLIDGDLRRPVIAKLFGIEQIPGLTDVILGNYEWHNVVKSVTDLMMGRLSIEEIMKTPGLDNLHIITSGTYSPSPSEIINSRAIGEFMDSIRKEYDIILIDAPPVLAATDAALWSSRVDGTALVYQVGKIARGALRRSKMSLENLKANVIGVVLNGLKAEISPDFGQQDYYYYYYGREKAPVSLSKKIKDKILTGPQSIWYALGSIFRKKPVAMPEEDTPTGNGKGTGNGEDKRTVIAAKIDSIKTEESAAETKREKKQEKAKPWLKIFMIFLLIILLALGLLYQAGYLKIRNTIKSSWQQPVVSETIPVAPKETEIVKTTVVPPTAPLPIVPEKETAAAVIPAKEAEAERPFSIQIKAVPASEEARRDVETLKAKGEDAFSMRVAIKGREAWDRIFIGRFATKEEAVKYVGQNKIKTRYPGSIVRNTSTND
ncbi:MAG: AAA family ATPase [Deltaproteobacteria bacterium]|nr:AAA family ATPase [Deltaproteobacteria bacterium]